MPLFLHCCGVLWSVAFCEIWSITIERTLIILLVKIVYFWLKILKQPLGQYIKTFYDHNYCPNLII